MEIALDKLEQQVYGFVALPEVMHGLKADHGFCCLWNDDQKAGSKDKQYVIDHDIVIAFAKGWPFRWCKPNLP